MRLKEFAASQQLIFYRQVDIWSFGITLIELAKQKPPNSHLPPLRVLTMIPMQPAPRLKGDFSEDFRAFVDCCLQKEPENVRFYHEAD
jgi:serine/threonine-protein kinase 24/25/MST4